MSGVRVRALLVGLAGVLAAAGLSGCGAAPEQAPEQAAAEAVASRFLALASSDPEQACVLLAPATREELQTEAKSECGPALGEAELPAVSAVRDVTIAGHAAQVRLDSDVVFLALFDDGWRVSASGCTKTSPDPAVPYSCSVKGG